MWNPTHRHKKGGEYMVLGLGKHTETEEELVVYESRDGSVWCRPKSNFEEHGRFVPIEDEIDIIELREAGEDAGALMGYYCRGHVDFWKFAIEANHLSGACEGHDDRFVRKEDCRHGWWRAVPIPGLDGHSQFVPSPGPGQGAFAVTFCESVANAAEGRDRVRRNWMEHAARQSAAQASSWAYRWLQSHNPELAAEFLEAYGNSKE